MINVWKYTKTLVLGEEFLAATGNRYSFVGQRPYRDTKGELPDGVTLTLRILSDSMDYGIDKKTKKRRPTNRGQNFEVTVLCGCQELPYEYEDIIALEGFDQEHSFAVDFNLLMRFQSAKLLEKAMGDDDDTQSIE